MAEYCCLVPTRSCTGQPVSMLSTSASAAAFCRVPIVCQPASSGVSPLGMVCSHPSQSTEHKAQSTARELIAERSVEGGRTAQRSTIRGAHRGSDGRPRAE